MEPGVKRMADDSPAPPLTRRVPGAARGGPISSVRPALPEALLKRMQAAVEAARAEERSGAGNQKRSPARLGLAAPPTETGKPRAPAPPMRMPPPAKTRPPARKSRRRGPKVAGVASLAVILTAAVAVVLSSQSSARTPESPQSGQPQPQASQSQPPGSPGSHRSPPGKSADTTSVAAAWVAVQVGHDALVACDQAMCEALTAHGFPGRHLRLIRPHSPVPRAQVIVATPVVLRQFGSLSTRWAPAALARFGAGSASITVRLVAPHGTTKYEAALKADLRSRKASGARLTDNPHISASATARKQLIAGQVDSRLIVVLTALASVHPIRILDFGAPFAGESAGMPLRIANLAQDYAVAGLTRSAYVGFLTRQLNLEPGIYQPEVAGLTHDAAGTLIFQIKYPAPSPLGVLGPQGP